MKSTWFILVGGILGYLIRSLFAWLARMRKRPLPKGYKLRQSIHSQFKWYEYDVIETETGRIISTGDTEEDALAKFRTSTESGGRPVGRDA